MVDGRRSSVNSCDAKKKTFPRSSTFGITTGPPMP
jgi:hypothetical protein